MIDTLNMMTVEPYVLPMHPEEFLAFVRASASRDDLIKAFLDETGTDMAAFFRSPIEQMVDRACGHNPRMAALAKFMDWLAIWYWGVEGCTCNPEAEEILDSCPFHGAAVKG